MGWSETLRQGAEQGKEQEVENVFTREGLQVNNQNEEGRTALHVAMRHNHLAIVRILLARPDIKVFFYNIGIGVGVGKKAFLCSKLNSFFFLPSISATLFISNYQSTPCPLRCHSIAAQLNIVDNEGNNGTNNFSQV